MADVPFYAISVLALGSFSFALQIRVGHESHKSKNVTVTLIHDEGDPTDIFLKKIPLNNHSRISNDVVQVPNFTADAQVNVTFDRSDKYMILAYGNASIDPAVTYAIAKSDEFEIQYSYDRSPPVHHLHNGPDKGLIVSTVLGSVALITIILLTIDLIFLCSRRHGRFQDRLVRHSDSVSPANSFVEYLYAKYPPGRNSGNASYRETPPPVYVRSSPTLTQISFGRSMTTKSTISSTTTFQNDPLTDRQMEIQDRLHGLQDKLLKLERESREIQGDIEAAENEADILDTKAKIGALKDFLESPWALNATNVIPSEMTRFFTS
ncbi:hypothetical protein DFS33DRAFT_1358891 [Desarmillaria ectypa]|nr:hypothetical protein DFS33DRAFT_1358891 [Desarmillaria ectypa]